MNVPNEIARLRRVVESQEAALLHWRRAYDAVFSESTVKQEKITLQAYCLRDAARMLEKHRGQKTEGAVLLDRIEQALKWPQPHVPYAGDAA